MKGKPPLTAPALVNLAISLSLDRFLSASAICTYRSASPSRAPLRELSLSVLVFAGQFPFTIPRGGDQDEDDPHDDLNLLTLKIHQTSDQHLKRPKFRRSQEWLHRTGTLPLGTRTDHHLLQFVETQGISSGPLNPLLHGWAKLKLAFTYGRESFLFLSYFSFFLLFLQFSIFHHFLY